MPKDAKPEELDDDNVLVVDQSTLDADPNEDVQPGEPLAAKRLSDEDLKATCEGMNKISADMKKLQDEIDASGVDDSEKNAQWDAMNDEFDALKQNLEAHDRFEAKASKRRQQLRDIAEANNRLPKDVRDRLRGGQDPDSVDVEEYHDRLVKGNRRLVGAVKGWMKAQVGKRSAITQAEIEDCRALGFHPYDKEIALPIMEQTQFDEARDLFVAAMGTAQPGQTNHARCRQEARRAIRNALSTETPTATALEENYLFGTTFNADLEEARLAYGGIIPNVDYMRTANGNPIYFSTMNDTANTGRMISEAVANPAAVGAKVADADPAFGRMTLYAFLGTSDRVVLSNSLLEDNAVGLETKLPAILGKRLGRLENRMGTLGLGVGSEQPDGVVPQSALGFTSASATAIVYDEMIELEHAIDYEIRQNEDCKYMLHDQTVKMLRKLKDGNGNYLWQVDARSGAPDTLNTYPYIVNQNMAVVATGAKAVLFGAFMSYKFRIVVGRDSNGGVRLKRLDEVYAESDQTAYLAFERIDGRLLNPGDNPIKHLLQP